MTQYTGLLYSSLLLASMLACPNLALAEIYVTYPIANTSFQRGQLAKITWIDDGHKPHLERLGQFRIDLFARSDTFVMTLAEKVSPIARSHTLVVPQNVPSNTSDYTMQMVFSGKHSRRIYTADFTINPPQEDIDSHETTNPNVIWPMATFVLPDTTVVSRLLPTSYEADTSTSTIYADSLRHDDTTPNAMQKTSHSGGVSARLAINLERTRFKFVFIAWPALIGISMAM